MEREPFFDNLKVLLIFLVVFGHFANIYADFPLMGGINNVIYSFHMPLFIFVSGYFSKNISAPRITDISGILIPFFLFQLLSIFFNSITHIGFSNSNIFVPINQMWYLIALFFWRLLCPFLNFFDPPQAMAFLVSLGLIIGFYLEYFPVLALDRTLFYFPVFALGFYSKNLPLFIGNLKRIKPLIVFISIILIAIIFYLSYTNKVYCAKIYYCFVPTMGYGVDQQLLNLGLRVLGLFCSFMISLSILFFIPKKQTVFSEYGKNTFAVFLLHFFLILPLTKFFPANELYLLGLSILFSILITLLLIQNFISKALNTLFKK